MQKQRDGRGIKGTFQLPEKPKQQMILKYTVLAQSPRTSAHEVYEETLHLWVSAAELK